MLTVWVCLVNASHLHVSDKILSMCVRFCLPCDDLDQNRKDKKPTHTKTHHNVLKLRRTKKPPTLQKNVMFQIITLFYIDDDLSLFTWAGLWRI